MSGSSFLLWVWADTTYSTALAKPIELALDCLWSEYLLLLALIQRKDRQPLDCWEIDREMYDDETLCDCYSAAVDTYNALYETLYKGRHRLPFSASTAVCSQSKPTEQSYARLAEQFRFSCKIDDMCSVNPTIL